MGRQFAGIDMVYLADELPSMPLCAASPAIIKHSSGDCQAQAGCLNANFTGNKYCHLPPHLIFPRVENRPFKQFVFLNAKWMVSS